MESIEKESKIDGQEKIENVKRFSSKTGWCFQQVGSFLAEFSGSIVCKEDMIEATMTCTADAVVRNNKLQH